MPTNLNPLALLDQILADWASPKVRRLIHLIILLVVAIVTLVLAAEGNWKEALISLAVTAYAAANKANTPPISTDLPEDPYPEGYTAAMLAEEAAHADDSTIAYGSQSDYLLTSDIPLPEETGEAVSRNDEGTVWYDDAGNKHVG